VAQNLGEAYKLREKVTQRERFYIESHYYDRALGDLEKAEQIYEVWQRTYPRGDDETYTNLALIYITFGRYEKALEQAREAARLHPEDLGNKMILAYALLTLERLDEAQTLLDEIKERQPDPLLLERYEVAFLKGDTREMERLAKAAGSDDDSLLADWGVSEAYHGRLRKARELFRRSVESAKRNDALERAAGYRADLGVVEAYFGYPQQARADAVAAATLDPNFQISPWGDVVDPVLPMALSGDTGEAEKLAAELSTRLPRNTAVQRFYLPTFGAAIALQRKQADKVLSLLQGLSSPEQSAVAEMHPSYLRGQAYLMLHNGGGAAIEKM